MFEDISTHSFECYTFQLHYQCNISPHDPLKIHLLSDKVINTYAEIGICVVCFL